MRFFVVVLILTLSFPALARVVKYIDDQAIFLDYHWSKGYSSYRDVRVIISASGAVDVKATIPSMAGIEYKTQLSNQELTELKELLYRVDFFAQKDGTRAVPDSGETVLSVRMDGKSKKLKFYHLQAIQPVTQFLWRLVTQARTMSQIEQDKDIHMAMSTITTNRSPSGLLQPDRFKEPLMGYIKVKKDRQNVVWALEALASLLTIDEYSAYIAQELKGTQRDLLLSIIGATDFYGNISKAYLLKLCPVYVSEAKAFREDIKNLTKVENQALEEFTRLLGHIKCKSAIPVLKQWFEAHQKPYMDMSLAPLSQMGVDGLSVLIPYLDSANMAYKMNAMELMVLSSRHSPYAEFSDPLSESGYNKMIPLFVNSIIPKLVHLSKNGASADIREKAAKAVKEIKQRIEHHVKNRK